MLRISATQFEQLWFAQFMDKVSEHLRRYFELPCRIAGDACVRETIRLGVTRARRWGLTLEASAQSYIDHMVMLGSDFDSDPQLPWAREILERKQPELVRLDSLHAQTADYMARTAGEDSREVFFAVARARAHGLCPDLAVPPSQALEQVSTWLARMYPQKYRLVAYRLPELVLHAEAIAFRHGFERPRALGRVLGMMFLMGGGVCDEPMTPWVGAILRDTRHTADEREEKLWSSLCAYADRWLQVARSRGILQREAPEKGANQDVQQS
jgi:hypothetical protein